MTLTELVEELFMAACRECMERNVEEQWPANHYALALMTWSDCESRRLLGRKVAAAIRMLQSSNGN